MPVFNFKGKSIIHSHHLGVPFRELIIDQKKSLAAKDENGKKHKPSLDDNLIIQGDNLHALKALLPRYAERVKCIYIDPPYNTGNEGWKYSDNVNSPLLQAWLEQNGIMRDDLERHDKWLCMMWPRLQILRELLADDGVIFISIDDNEHSNLKQICDEIFQPKNFLTSITTIVKTEGRSYGFFSKTHEYILVYSKNTDKTKLNGLEVEDRIFKYEDTIGEFNLKDLRNGNVRAFNATNRPNLRYPFYVNENNPDKDNLLEVSVEKKHNWREVYPIKIKELESVWRWGKETALKNQMDNLVARKGSDGIVRVFQKYRSKEQHEKTVWIEKEILSNRGTNEIQEIFKQPVFDFPKPLNLLKRIIRISTEEDDIILDSFAGSGTTAQAVLDLNKEDGGNRKFVLVECEDYADKITAERVRRVIKGVPKANDAKLKAGLGGSFTYCTLGAEISEDNLLKAKSLPSAEALIRYVFYTATGKTLGKVPTNENFYISKVDQKIAFFVIYKPSKAFLKSDDAALHLDRKREVQKIMKQKRCDRAIVFAASCFYPLKELSQERITFCQLPFAIHRILA